MEKTKTIGDITYTIKVKTSLFTNLSKIFNFKTKLGVFENKRRFKVDYNKITTLKGGPAFGVLKNEFDSKDNNSLLIELNDNYLKMEIPLKQLNNKGSYKNQIYKSLGKIVDDKGSQASKNAYHKKWLNYYKAYFFNGFWGKRFDMISKNTFRKGVFTGQLANAFKYKEGKLEQHKKPS